MAETKLARNIRTLRRQMRWRQDDLADHLGIARGKISSYELRDVQPRLELLTKMASLFGVSIDKLVNGELAEHSQDTAASTSPYASLNRATEGGQSHVTILKERIRHQEEIIRQMYEMNSLKDEILQTMRTEMDAMVKPHGISHSSRVSPVQWSTHDAHGTFVNWNTIDIPTDHYIEIGPGIVDRLVEHPEDLRFDWEEIFAPYMQQFDFDKQRVIFNRSAAGAKFPLHYHVEHEVLICVKGAFRETVGQQDIGAGDRIAFDSFEAHELHFIEDTLIVLSLAS